MKMPLPTFHKKSTPRYRFQITPSSVGNDLYYDLSLAPSEFWDHVRSDGGDIRVTKQDGTTEVAREVSGFDYAGHKGSLFFATGAGTSFYIYYGNPSATEPAEDATYGKYAVWESANIAKLHSEDYNDSTENQNNGTNGGTTIVDGKIRKAWNFDVPGREIDLGNSPDFYPANAITILVWIKTSTEPGYICMPANDGFYYFGVGTVGGGKISAYIDGVGGWWQGTTNLTDNEWHLVAFTYDKDAGADNVGLYVDGVREFTATATGSIPTSKNQVNIKLGHRYGGSYFVGLMEEFAFYNRALTSTEIATMYANQNDPASFWTTGEEEAGYHPITP